MNDISKFKPRGTTLKSILKVGLARKQKALCFQKAFNILKVKLMLF
jgi:hypothetical protein